MEAEGVVGSKGELFVPKKIREKLGLKPKKRVRYRVVGNKLVVEPIKTVEELLEEEPKATIELEEFFEFRRKLSKRLET